LRFMLALSNKSTKSVTFSFSKRHSVFLHMQSFLRLIMKIIFHISYNITFFLPSKLSSTGIASDIAILRCTLFAPLTRHGQDTLPCSPPSSRLSLCRRYAPNALHFPARDVCGYRSIPHYTEIHLNQLTERFCSPQ